MNFEEIYKTVEQSSHETAFNKEECKILFDILSGFLSTAVVVEIGVEFGRSTSVIAEVAKEKGFSFYAVDNWSGEYGSKAKAHVVDQIRKHGWGFDLISMSSYDFYERWDKSRKIDLIHIDGDHEFEAVLLDCNIWLPLLKKDGYALFDDYGHDSLPGVYQAVETYMNNSEEEFEYMGKYGNKLGVFKRL